MNVTPPPRGCCLSGGEGVKGDPPQHIRKELQECTTLTHSAYTFVIMSEDSNSTHLFGYVSYKLAQTCHWSVQKSVEHAFCAALYASYLFFPLHLS